jgi:hypothetical protein
LPEAGRRLVVEHLRSLGVNVNHPDHVSWKTDSPTTHDPQADAAIRAKHETDEPLVAFIPKSTPREVFAGDQVSGPERTPGPADPHRPAAGATFYEPKPGDPGYEPSRPGGDGGSGHDGSGPGGPGGGGAGAQQKQLPAGEGVVTSDNDTRSVKAAARGKGEVQSRYEVLSKSPDPNLRAQALMADRFAREGHQVHVNADDTKGDLRIDGVAADVKRLNQARSINSAVKSGIGQAPQIIIDATHLRLTQDDAALLLRNMEADVAKNPDHYKGHEEIETIYFVLSDTDMRIFHWHGAAPIAGPDPANPTIRSASD